MTVGVPMRVLELLTARLCHELISPVAAIGNGAELLAEDEPEFIKDAVALVGDSARKAGGRLQFYRFAYGFGLGGGGLAGPAPHELAAEFFQGTRVVCDYREGLRKSSPDWQKLACNLLVVGSEGLPRGGRLVVDAGVGGPSLDVTGEPAGLSSELRAALTLAAPVGELTSRTIGAYFTGLLARTLECRIVIGDREPGHFVLGAAAL